MSTVPLADRSVSRRPILPNMVPKMPLKKGRTRKATPNEGDERSRSWRSACGKKSWPNTSAAAVP